MDYNDCGSEAFVMKILFIVIMQYLTCFLKYVLKVGSKTGECKCVKIGVFLCLTLNTLAIFFYLRESLHRPTYLVALAAFRTAIK